MDIRHLVDEYYTFSDGFSQYHRDIDDILKKVRGAPTAQSEGSADGHPPPQSLDELLIQQVSNSIRASVESTSNLSQIAQIVVNAEHFKLACTSLESLLAALRAPHRGGRLRLDASGHFSQSLDLAQRRIDAALGAKLKEFVEMGEFDATPTRLRTEEPEYVGEMTRWLTTMMESVLVLLPQETKLLHCAYGRRGIVTVRSRSCARTDRSAFGSIASLLLVRAIAKSLSELPADALLCSE
jgi:hypothetical protein